MLTYLNVRSYGYINMKAIGSLFSPGFDSSDDCQRKEEAKCVCVCVIVCQIACSVP